MTVKESLPNYLYKAAMYQQFANFYKYRNPNFYNYFYLKHTKNLEKESRRMLTVNRKYSQPLPARLRVVHLGKANPRLDIFIDGTPFITNCSYREMNPYLSISPGKHRIRINVAGKPSQHLLNKNISFDAGRYYTLLSIEGAGQMKRVLALEDQPEVPVGEAKIRFLNLLRNAQEVDIAVKNRDVIFPKLKHCHASAYLGITPMKLELEARKSGTNEVVLHFPILSLEPNTAYTGVILENEVILLA